jgi:hypothetical protein
MISLDPCILDVAPYFQNPRAEKINATHTGKIGRGGREARERDDDAIILFWMSSDFQLIHSGLLAF